MRWDPISRRLRELPSGRSSAMPILTYVFVLSALMVAAGFAAALLPPVPPHGMFSPLPGGGYRLPGRRILDDPAANPSLQKTGGVRHPSAGGGGISGLCPLDGQRGRFHHRAGLPLFLERPGLPSGDWRRKAVLPPRRDSHPLPGPAERQRGGGPKKVPRHAADALTGDLTTSQKRQVSFSQAVARGEAAPLRWAMKSVIASTAWACCSSAEMVAGRSPFCGP